MKQLLHTPEGVRDIYNTEYGNRLETEDRIRTIIRRYGYSELQTPTFEFFDIFSKDRGSVSSREMYKFFDRDGNTLVLRPDMTPPVARCAAKYYTDEPFPVKLSYLGSTFINHTSYRGRLRESTVIGAESIGDPSADADAEVIAAVVEALLASGLRDFQIVIGQVAFFDSLAAEAGLDPQTKEMLRDLIDKKNFFGVEELIREHIKDEKLSKVMLKLPEMIGGPELLDEVLSAELGSGSREAIERLKELYSILEIYGATDHVSFDLGMLGKYSYYTGIIFRGMTYGVGEPIVSGGRYDDLMKQFGKDAPAVGFCISIDGLMSALSRQNVKLMPQSVDNLIVYTPIKQQAAIKLAKKLRASGKSVILMSKGDNTQLGELVEYARRSHIDCVLYLQEGSNEIESIVTKEDRK